LRNVERESPENCIKDAEHNPMTTGNSVHGAVESRFP
jgi:hypothetical protein